MRVVMVHGWEGNPKNCWFPWLRDKLEEKGFEIVIPAMPDSEHPIIDVWVDYLKGIVGDVDKDTYFVGHSVGAQAILRFLEKSERVGGMVFVSGWFTLKEESYEGEEDRAIAKAWLETPIDFEKLKRNKIVAIFSDNDEFVPVSDSKLFEERLNAKIIIEHNRGHFDDEANIKELPIVLDELLKMLK